jgi:hypothetical protein
MAEYRAAALRHGRPRSRIAAMAIVTFWSIGAGMTAWWWLAR